MTEEKTVLRENLSDLWKHATARGKILTVKFEKKDGSTRVLNGRAGVTYCLHGGVNTAPHYLKLFDLHKQEYRNINPATISEIRSAGVRYCIVD